jgi:hypothetical protein
VCKTAMYKEVKFNQLLCRYAILRYRPVLKQLMVLTFREDYCLKMVMYFNDHTLNL